MKRKRKIQSIFGDGGFRERLVKKGSTSIYLWKLLRSEIIWIMDRDREREREKVEVS